MKHWDQAAAEAAEREACRKLALDLAEAAERRLLTRGYAGTIDGYREAAIAAGCRAVAAAIEARGRALEKRQA